MESLLKRNYEYFNTKILENYYIFTTNFNKSIIVKVEEENLAHLLGIQYATENGLYRYSATKFWKEMSKYIDDAPPFSSLYDLISKEDDLAENLGKEQKWCKQRNIHFIELFSHLNNFHYEIYLYKNSPSEDFKTNYFQIKIIDDSQYLGYIGIYGDDNDNYFKFNSIIIDEGEKLENTNNCISIKKFEIVKKENFDENNYTFMPSPQFKIVKQKKTKKYSLSNKDVNEINKKINPFSLKKGNKGKGNYQLRKGKEILEVEFEKVQNWSSAEEIIRYIEKNHKGSK